MATPPIKKITNPQEFLSLLDRFESLFEEENKDRGHFLPIKKESLARLAQAQLLAWHYHVWAGEDGIIIFAADNSLIFGEVIFQEILWLSKNPKISLTLLREAIKFARAQGWTNILMGSSCRMNNLKLEKFYKRLNLKKDSIAWTGKI